MTGLEACKSVARLCATHTGVKATIYYGEDEEWAVNTLCCFFLEYAKENNNDIWMRAEKYRDTIYISYINNSYIYIRPIGTFPVERPNLAIYPETFLGTPLAEIIQQYTQTYISPDGSLEMEAVAVPVSFLSLDERCAAFQKSPELDKFLDSFKIIGGE